MEPGAPDPKNPSLEFSAVEEINTLDTARLSLRWALEKLSSLQKENQAQAAGLAQETELRQKAQQDLEQFERLNMLRPKAGPQRQAFDEELERFALLALAGKLGAAPLAARELELQKLEQALKAAALEQERSLEARRQELEQSYAQSEQAVQKHKDWIAQTTLELTQRLGALSAREEALKQSDLELSGEKAALRGLAAEWDKKAREQFLRILELEKAAQVADEHKQRAEHAAALAAQASAHAEALRAELREIHGALHSRLSESELKFREERRLREEAESRLAELDETYRRETAVHQRRLEEFSQAGAAAEEQARGLRAEIQGLRQDHADQAARILELERGLLLHERQQAVAARRAELQEHGKHPAAEKEGLERKALRLTGNIDQLKAVITRLAAKNEELEKSLAAAQNAAQNATAAGLQHSAATAARNAELEKRVQAAEKTAREAALEVIALAAQKSTLERQLAEIKAPLAFKDVNQDFQRLSAEKTSWQLEKELLQKEIDAERKEIAAQHQEIVTAAAAQKNLAQRLAQAERLAEEAAAKEAGNAELSRQLEQANGKIAQLSAALAAETQRCKKLEEFIAARLQG